MYVVSSIHVLFTWLQNTQICFNCAVSMFFGVSQYIQFATHRNFICLVNILLRLQFWTTLPVWTEHTVKFGMGTNQ